MVRLSIACVLFSAIATLALPAENQKRDGAIPSIRERAEESVLSKRGAEGGAEINGLARRAAPNALASQIVIQNWNKFSSQIADVCNQISTGRITTTTIYAQLQIVATGIGSQFDGFRGCSQCLLNGVDSFKASFQSLFIQFKALIVICQRKFQDKWVEWFKQIFVSIQFKFSSFFQYCNQKGISVSSFVSVDFKEYFKIIGLKSLPQYVH